MTNKMVKLGELEVLLKRSYGTVMKKSFMTAMLAILLPTIVFAYSSEPMPKPAQTIEEAIQITRDYLIQCGERSERASELYKDFMIKSVSYQSPEMFRALHPRASIFLEENGVLNEEWVWYIVITSSKNDHSETFRLTRDGQMIKLWDSEL